MFKTFNQDRKFIENKYHNVNEPFNFLNLLLRYDFDCDIIKKNLEVVV